MITMSAGQVIVWVIIGGLAGAIAGMIVKRRKSGFGVISNILIGLVGAFIGGILFDVKKPLPLVVEETEVKP